MADFKPYVVDVHVSMVVYAQNHIDAERIAISSFDEEAHNASGETQELTDLKQLPDGWTEDTPIYTDGLVDLTVKDAMGD